MVANLAVVANLARGEARAVVADLARVANFTWVANLAGKEARQWLQTLQEGKCSQQALR